MKTRYEGGMASRGEKIFPIFLFTRIMNEGFGMRERLNLADRGYHWLSPKDLEPNVIFD